MKKKLDIFHAHEALDRTYVCMNHFIYYVRDHDFIEENLELKQLAMEIENKLGDLYIKVGQEYEFMHANLQS